jgi:hypothetical protein
LATTSNLAQKKGSVRKAKKPTRKRRHALRLIDIVIVLVILGLLSGGLLIGGELIKLARIRSQISQIAKLDEAIAIFYEKYGGLPGDLLAISAERAGMSYGDGTPAHSDGDGKISPCNLGWQWSLGCETALFWSQLSAEGLISGNYSANNRLVDNRLLKGANLIPYMPVSPINENAYITVWSTDPAQPSPQPQLPYGNYYEITRINGITIGNFVDDSRALTPLQARAIDEKMDDGSPRTGRVVVNGEANWPYDAWGTFAKPGERNCVLPDHTYNSYEYMRANRALCHLAIAFNCCTRSE